MDHFRARKRADQDENSAGFDGSDDGGAQKPKKRKRVRLTAQQLAVMERVFWKNRYPNADHCKEISEDMQLPLHSVQIWFQNRRAKYRRLQKKQQSENMPVSPDLEHPRRIPKHGDPGEDSDSPPPSSTASPLPFVPSRSGVAYHGMIPPRFYVAAEFSKPTQELLRRMQIANPDYSPAFPAGPEMADPGMAGFPDRRPGRPRKSEQYQQQRPSFGPSDPWVQTGVKMDPYAMDTGREVPVPPGVRLSTESSSDGRARWSSQQPSGYAYSSTPLGTRVSMDSTSSVDANYGQGRVPGITLHSADPNPPWGGGVNEDSGSSMPDLQRPSDDSPDLQQRWPTLHDLMQPGQQPPRRRFDRPVEDMQVDATPGIPVDFHTMDDVWSVPPVQEPPGSTAAPWLGSTRASATSDDVFADPLRAPAAAMGPPTRRHSGFGYDVGFSAHAGPRASYDSDPRASPAHLPGHRVSADSAAAFGLAMFAATGGNMRHRSGSVDHRAGGDGRVLLHAPIGVTGATRRSDSLSVDGDYPVLRGMPAAPGGIRQRTGSFGYDLADPAGYAPPPAAPPPVPPRRSGSFDWEDPAMTFTAQDPLLGSNASNGISSMIIGGTEPPGGATGDPFLSPFDGTSHTSMVPDLGDGLMLGGDDMGTTEEWRSRIVDLLVG